MERSDIIKKYWDNIHGRFIPMFKWRYFANMRYFYNENDNSITCECGTSVKIDLKDNEINRKSLKDLIRKLEVKVYRYFKDNYKVDLGIDD